MVDVFAPYKTYAHQVISGDVVACEYVRLACQRYLGYFERDDLTFDPMKIDKVINFIGKLKHFTGSHNANMLTPDFRETHPGIPWKMVSGMLNYIVHEYFQIDDIVVWDVVTNNPRPLRDLLESYLENTDWTKWITKESKQDED